MSELAKGMPGYISHKGFLADDGEKVTIVEFENEETQRAWAHYPEHVDAKKKGRADFYSEYKISHPQEVLELKIKAVLRAKVVEDFFNVGL